MNDSLEEYLKNLLETENIQLKKLNKIVVQSLKGKKLISQKLEREAFIKEHWADRLSDKVALFGGSWKFLIIFFVIIAVWVVLNLMPIFTLKFDPYPFVFLNLLLSLLAAIQAPIILMSQNRQASKDRKHSEHDYLINLKAELEIRSLHQKIDLILIEHLKALLKSQAEQLQILKNLAKKLKHVTLI